MSGDSEVQIMVTISSTVGFLARGFDPPALPRGFFKYDLLRKSFTRRWPFNRKRTALSVNHPVLLDLLFCGAEVTQADRWTRMLAHWCFSQ